MRTREEPEHWVCLPLHAGCFSKSGCWCGRSALGQCLFHLIQQVAKQGGIAAFPIYGYRVLSLQEKGKIHG